MESIYRLRSDIVHGRAKISDIDEMLPQAERAFTAIFKWFAQALDRVGVEDIVAQLDDALVAGGSKWVANFVDNKTGD